MDLQIALVLAQDGIVNGAVYGLMALALVLVFSVTRVMFIPQGELVAFAALSMAALHTGGVPHTLWLLLALALATLLTETWRYRRGALLVGQLESLSSFWASAFKEVLVFTLIIPVLWWRSMKSHHVEDEE